MSKFAPKVFVLDLNFLPPGFELTVALKCLWAISVLVIMVVHSNTPIQAVTKFHSDYMVTPTVTM